MVAFSWSVSGNQLVPTWKTCLVAGLIFSLGVCLLSARACRSSTARLLPMRWTAQYRVPWAAMLFRHNGTPASAIFLATGRVLNAVSCYYSRFSGLISAPSQSARFAGLRQAGFERMWRRRCRSDFLEPLKDRRGCFLHARFKRRTRVDAVAAANAGP